MAVNCMGITSVVRALPLAAILPAHPFFPWKPVRFGKRGTCLDDA